jgi:hypothetical protein
MIIHLSWPTCFSLGPRHSLRSSSSASRVPHPLCTSFGAGAARRGGAKEEVGKEVKERQAVRMAGVWVGWLAVYLRLLPSWELDLQPASLPAFFGPYLCSRWLACCCFCCICCYCQEWRGVRGWGVTVVIGVGGNDVGCGESLRLAVC